MSTMNEAQHAATGLEGVRYAVLRRHSGYAIVAVIEEGPFSHDVAHARVEKLNRPAGMVTKKEAADLLGLSVQRIEQMVSDGTLTKERIGRRAFITQCSVTDELQKRCG